MSESQANSDLFYDLIIIGGGVAGLWLINQLSQRGYKVALFEKEQLGSQQTIASQGMIHGGVKYALSGALNKSSETVGDMPLLWKNCMQGLGPVNLSDTKILSDKIYLWSTQSIASKLTSFFASKALRGRVEKIDATQYPTIFQSPQFRGNIYRLIDLVLDIPSLLSNLADNCRSNIFKIDWDRAALHTDNQGTASLKLGEKNLHAQRFIFTAGEGNEQLLSQLGCQQPAMQRRPLQQVLVKHEYRESIYAHCMGSKPSPRLTISSHTTKDDRPVWYLGGDLATENTDIPANQLIEKAKTELLELFPWINFGKTEWATIKLDRAEPKQTQLLKPDRAFASRTDGVGNVISCWPTKLTLAPNLATEVEQLLESDSIIPAHPQDGITLKGLDFPEIAQPCWDRLF